MIYPKKHILVGDSVAAVSRFTAIGKHNSLVIDGEIVRMIMSDKESNNITSICKGDNQKVGEHVLFQKSIHNTSVNFGATCHLILVAGRIIPLFIK